MPVETRPDIDTTCSHASNAPHARAHREGAEAARTGAAIHTCPYRSPGLRTSWLRGYARAQQQSFDF
ncbi:CrpP family ICE-associated protein [Pseudomonas oryzihabitans]|uniref:ribosome modulation factor n=1 Tax=Pseudomonas oryzihabitans TaxID=47885 RepID=UPI002894A455|nr:CrpP family ICE-associated protein [Pseudomonas oryzihabitans]MDT3717895.1 CrpP family ICE-associated protein [Pseudomonas oryzihabitans]